LLVNDNGGSGDVAAAAAADMLGMMVSALVKTSNEYLDAAGI
jgi:Na+/citrate or Na+/malate symporter